MLFIISFLLFSNNIHSKLITYTLYQTDDLCQYNWKGSICLPIISFNQTNQPLVVQLDINNPNLCPTETLVYIRTEKCIYCSKNIHDIHCNHRRISRMISIEKKYNHRNYLPIISISLISILIVGSLFTLFFIKRSKAHTNLLELIPSSQPSNIKSLNHVKVSQPFKSIQMNLPLQSTHLIVPRQIKSTR
ncbi:hypothetical protein I4U23_007767 [Adineta vaga]|nr:hypothetical protein I4U23_007767 [Adineta vaga]